MTDTKVYKLNGEAYEISEDPTVYSSYESAYESAKEWEGFLGMSLDEAFACEEIMIEEVTLT
jgi:hypothetical protein